MICFITNQLNDEKDILTPVMTRPLLILSTEGQLLARFDSPATGWTHHALCQMNIVFEPAWSFCGADAYLGEQWVGSSEV